MKCIEKGCTGIVDITENIPLQIGCSVKCSVKISCFPCDTCGALYSPAGNRMYHSGFHTKPYLNPASKEVELKPITEEGVIEYFKKIAFRISNYKTRTGLCTCI